jgi:hypothetical protein
MLEASDKSRRLIGDYRKFRRSVYPDLSGDWVYLRFHGGFVVLYPQLCGYFGSNCLQYILICYLFLYCEDRLPMAYWYQQLDRVQLVAPPYEDQRQAHPRKVCTFLIWPQSLFINAHFLTVHVSLSYQLRENITMEDCSERLSFERLMPQYKINFVHYRNRKIDCTLKMLI